MRARLLATGAVVVVLLAVAGLLTYVNREALIDKAIRDRLKAENEEAFPVDPTGVRVLLCGTGAPELSGAAQACTLVAAGGRMFLFDVGEGATKSLADSGVPISDIEQVFITHYHSDHFNGLGTLINQSWNWGRTTPLRVAGPTGTGDVVGALAAAYALDNRYRTENMADRGVDLDTAQAVPTDIVIPSGEQAVRVYDRDGVTIDARLVAHDPVRPALGYVLQYQGKKIFISGDTAVSPQNLPAMQDADLVVHEAYAAHLVRRAIPAMRELGMTDDAEVAERTIVYHADTVELAKQAQQAGVRRLALTHLIPYPSGALQRYLFTRGMAEYFDGEITVGRDGMQLTV